MTPSPFSPPPAPPPANANRRSLLKIGGLTLGAAAFTKAMSPIFSFAGDQSVDSLLQNHYRELGPEDLKAVLTRLEADAKAEYGADVKIRDPQAIPGVKFGYALNLTACIGCRKCVEACHVENNHDRSSYQSYIRVLEMDKGTLDLEHGNADS